MRTVARGDLQDVVAGLMRLRNVCDESPDNEPEAMTGLANELCPQWKRHREAASLFAANEFLVTRPSRLVAAQVARPAPPGRAFRALT